MDIANRYKKCFHELKKRNQEQVFNWWNDLGPEMRDHLLSEIESIPWEIVDQLIETHIRRKPNPPANLRLKPARVYPQKPTTDQHEEYRKAIELGRRMIREGKVAAFTVAGGQGTRLGFDGPKGTLLITPVQEKTLFQLFAETIVAVGKRHNIDIPWYIMTNPANHGQTQQFLRFRNHFGIPENNVVVFPQAMLPSLEIGTGKMLTTSWNRLALAPDGHGGAIKALVNSGGLEDMKKRGIEVITYFQIDNPLVKIFDPLFIGLHVMNRAEMSAKVASKVNDFEKVGNVCKQDGRTIVIEYSDFPDELAQARNDDGSRKFDVGSLGIHCIDVAFIDRLISEDIKLPYHRAEKTVTWMDANGFQRTPRTKNAVKLETFIFDALPFAKNPVLLEVDRSEEFAPVKNKAGEESPTSSRQAQIRRGARWLEAAGVKVPRKSNGEPDAVIEIAPLYALDVDDVKERVKSTTTLVAGETIYVSLPSPETSEAFEHNSIQATGATTRKGSLKDTIAC
jgi:UDP-N-acetylglucosamine/UDP-N-acetylgalactosamine diphosphorylase